MKVSFAKFSVPVLALAAFAWLALAAKPSALQSAPFQPHPGIVPVDCAGDCVESCQEANPNNEQGYQTCLANCLKGCDLPDVPDVPPPSPGIHLSSDLHFECIDNCKTTCRIDHPNEDGEYWGCVNGCAKNCPPPESDPVPPPPPPPPEPDPGDTAKGTATLGLGLVPMDCAGDCVESCQEANPNNEQGYQNCLSNCLEGCGLPDVPEAPEPTPVPDPGGTSD